MLDNVNEETAVTLHDVFPRHNSGGRILMTTRVAATADRLTASGGSSQLALQSLGLDDAIAMLLAGALLEQEGREGTRDMTIERLVRSVGSLPLAIDQAASFIRETGAATKRSWTYTIVRKSRR